MNNNCSNYKKTQTIGIGLFKGSMNQLNSIFNNSKCVCSSGLQFNNEIIFGCNYRNKYKKINEFNETNDSIMNGVRKVFDDVYQYNLFEPYFEDLNHNTFSTNDYLSQKNTLGLFFYFETLFCDY